jgi:hypothetical protein
MWLELRLNPSWQDITILLASYHTVMIWQRPYHTVMIWQRPISYGHDMENPISYYSYHDILFIRPYYWQHWEREYKAGSKSSDSEHPVNASPSDD